VLTSRRWTTLPGRMRPEVAGITIKTVLVMGLGVTVAVWLWAGSELTQRMSRLEAETSAVNRRFADAQERLSSVRTQVLLASLGVRDALLEPDATKMDAQRAQFGETCRMVKDALSRYVPVMDSPAERAHIEALRREVSEFERSMRDVFLTTEQDWQQAHLVLQRQVVPRRQTVIEVSDQVQRLNMTAFATQRLAMTALHRTAERQAWRRLGGALAVSLAIGLMAAVYAHRLETSVKQQRLRDLQLTHDLYRLSGRLATAQEDERRTISRDLHDEVGQSLAALKVELSLARRADAVRNMSHLLHPPLLDDLGLAAAMKSWIDGFSKRHGIDAALVQKNLSRRLEPEAETALYRIVQEALTNVAKHAHARTCRVSLEQKRATLQITIEDDGVGFNPDALAALDAQGGLGLISIRERVAQIGGSLVLTSGPGRGTRIVIELPHVANLNEGPVDGETANLPR
jgi:signal transduction histidine kinase